MQCRVTRSFVLLTIGVLVATMVPRTSEARVVRFVIEQRQPFAEGVEWGTSGAYERRLVGTAYLEVDPGDPLNALIVDLDKAPRNARGKVEFSTAFFMLKPMDMARGNHKIFYTVNNRGNGLALDFSHPLIAAQTADQVGRNDIALRLG